MQNIKSKYLNHKYASESPTGLYTNAEDQTTQNHNLWVQSLCLCKVP